jgi:hypothetical protein
VFLIALELIVLYHRHVPIIVIFLLLISLSQGKIVASKWKFSILPAFFSLSSAALLYLITAHYQEQIFILIATFLYYLSILGAYRLGKYEKDQTARGMNMAASSATIFFTYASAYGIYLNFLVPLWSLMLVYLLVTLLVSYQYFSLIYDYPKTSWVYSLVLALAMSEVVWALSYWPFGYLTTGAVALILYYVLWDIVQSHFLNILSKRRVVANVAFFSLIIATILLTSKWIPVI